jgi:hypothetical protein
MEKPSQIALKAVPLRHFLPLKVVLLIEVLLYQIGSFGESGSVVWCPYKGYIPAHAPWGFVGKPACRPGLRRGWGIGTLQDAFSKEW